MSTNVLVPIDGSDQSYGGLVYALRSFPEATITTLHVINIEREWSDIAGFPDTWEERARKRAAEFHERANEKANKYNGGIETETVDGVPHKQILRYTIENNIDHIVMGSHGESPITRPFVGHVTEAVARRSPVSVSIVPESATDTESRDLPGRILVPVDGSEQATAALGFALNQFRETPITVLHVIDVAVDYSHEQLQGTYVEDQLDELRERADDLLRSTVEQTQADRDIQTETTYGKPAQSIVEFSSDNEFDQIVMGSRGRSRVAHLFGSVAETVVQRSPLPVTVVRESAGTH